MTAPELRRHIRDFLESDGEDRRYADLADDLRTLDRRLAEAGDARAEGEPTPGQRSAAKAGGDETSGGFPPRDKTAQEMGGESATGDDSSLPPFLRRQKRKATGAAAAQKGGAY